MTTPCKYLVKRNVDLDPPTLPHCDNNLAAYRALFIAIARCDFDRAFLLLNVFLELKLTRYLQERNKNVFVNFYHMAIMAFPLAEFKTLASFGEATEPTCLTSKGSGIFEIARMLKDQEKLTLLF